MIRTFWACLVAFFATLFYGSQVLIATALRVPGTFYSRTTQAWSRAIVRAAGIPITVEGAEHLSPDQPQVIVSNHLSAVDIVVKGAVLPLPYHFLGKKELNRVPFFGAAWRAAGHISLDRSNRQRAMESLKAASRTILRTGGKVIIYPEGTRSRSGELQPFKKGAFLLAVEAQVPVVPTVLIGTYGVFDERGALHPRPVKVVFGEPIPTVGLGSDDVEALATRAFHRMQSLIEANAETPALHR
jgi:1-acyl-sn-glycerol-3-phosphate acyltransferase